MRQKWKLIYSASRRVQPPYVDIIDCAFYPWKVYFIIFLCLYINKIGNGFLVLKIGVFIMLLFSHQQLYLAIWFYNLGALCCMELVINVLKWYRFKTIHHIVSYICRPIPYYLLYAIVSFRILANVWSIVATATKPSRWICAAKMSIYNFFVHNSLPSTHVSYVICRMKPWKLL